jgi:NAD+ kinase
MTQRRIGVVLHSDRSMVMAEFEQLSALLKEANIAVDEINGHQPISDVELVVVLGGDGTILKAVDFARESDAPLLGANLGRVGFLAEVQRLPMSQIADAVINRCWQVEPRFTITVDVVRNSEKVFSSFALNEVSIEKTSHELMTEIRLIIDQSPVMAYSGDGLVVATSTGSTAYAFSAGGPIVWPNADIMIAVPICAHALFARPIVVAPDSSITALILSDTATANFDGRRSFALQENDEVVVSRSSKSVKFARIETHSFAERLVTKFKLPTQSWREAR